MEITTKQYFKRQKEVGCGIVRGGERQQRQIGLWSSSGHQKGTQVINRIAGGGKEGNAS